jgi:hypothetical protein
MSPEVWAGSRLVSTRTTRHPSAVPNQDFFTGK